MHRGGVRRFLIFPLVARKLLRDLRGIGIGLNGPASSLFSLQRIPENPLRLMRIPLVITPLSRLENLVKSRRSRFPGQRAFFAAVCCMVVCHLDVLSAFFRVELVENNDEADGFVVVNGFHNG